MDLRAFLSRENMSIADFARRIDRPYRTADKWVRGDRIPGRQNRSAIEAFTRGQVTADSFTRREKDRTN